MARVTIIGLGQVGTSLGLALKANQPNVEIAGHDLSSDRLSTAKRLGAVDRAEWNLPAALEGAGIVVLAVPLSAVDKLFGDMAPHLAAGCIVTDTVAIKGPVLAAAARYLPANVSFVGGHPIPRPDVSFSAPAAGFFQGQSYCIVASPSATQSAVSQVIRMAELIGAKPLFLDEGEHDAYIAVLEQVPALLACLLMNLAADNASWRDSQRLAGARFAALTAAALDAPDEQVAWLQVNRDLVRGRLEALQQEIGELAELLRAGDDGAVRTRVEAAHERRAAWHPGAPPPSDITSPEVPSARDSLSSLFLGKRPKRR